MLHKSTVELSHKSTLNKFIDGKFLRSIVDLDPVEVLKYVKAKPPLASHSTP